MPSWLHLQFHHTCIQHKLCWTCQAGYTSSSITGLYTTRCAGYAKMASPSVPSQIYTTRGVLYIPRWLHLQFHHRSIQHEACCTYRAGCTSSSITDLYNTRRVVRTKLAAPPVPSQIYTTRGVSYVPSWLHLQFHHRSIQHEACRTYRAGCTSSSITGLYNTRRVVRTELAAPPVPSQVYTTRGVSYVPSWLHLQFHPMQRLLVISTYLSSSTRHRHNQRLLVISTYLSSSTRHRHNERMLGIPSRLHFHFHHTQPKWLQKNGYNFISITDRRCAARVKLVTPPVPSVFSSIRQLSVTSIRKNTTIVTGIGYNNHHPARD